MQFKGACLFIFVKLFAPTVKYHTSADNALACCPLLGYPVRRRADGKCREALTFIESFSLRSITSSTCFISASDIPPLTSWNNGSILRLPELFFRLFLYLSYCISMPFGYFNTGPRTNDNRKLGTKNRQCFFIDFACNGIFQFSLRKCRLQYHSFFNFIDCLVLAESLHIAFSGFPPLFWKPPYIYR